MAADELAAGTLFADRYRVEGIVAKGGMGAVYRAFDDRLGEPVALKVLPPDGPEGEDSIARFHREVRLARRVTHRNVARVFDLGESGGLIYLTMELIEGDSLRHVLHARKRLPLREALEAAIAIADGLAAAHEAGVVHRDLKPANVVVERSTGRLVVTDFGIARSLVDDDGLRTVGAIGTPAYMAPEQLLGEMVDGRSDVYALGVVLYEMLTGTRPFGGGHATAEARARLMGAPPDPRVHLALPETVARVVMGLMARRREERPASAADAAALLRRCLAGELERGSHPPAIALAADRVLAVLPFTWRGPEGESDLAEAIAEELADVLTRTRGLRVVARTASAVRSGSGDPRAAGSLVGAHAIVDGSVEHDGERLRVSVRLIEVAADDDTPLWSDRFEGGLDDVFALQSSMAARIAEALRVEIGMVVPAGDAGPEAVALYLRGRRELRAQRITEPGGAIETLERCVGLAPRFNPGLASYAVACVRGWFLSLTDRTRDWEALAQNAVEQALARAGDLPESHLAAGLFAAQHGRFRDVAIELGRAIEIAPTCVPAHEYLAGLELQAGRAAQGLARAQFVSELDPVVFLSLIDVARHHLLRGRTAELAATMAQLEARGAMESAAVLQLRMRAAAWRGEIQDSIRFGVALVEKGTGSTLLVQQFLKVLSGELQPAEALPLYFQPLVRANPRSRAFAYQLLAEMYGILGDVEETLKCVREAANGAFADLEWLDHCPALDVARGRPEMVEVRRHVMAAAEQIWTP